MTFSKTEEKVYEIVKPIAESLGYEIYDVRYLKEGPHKFLRVFISNENGVDLDDCEKVSRQLSDIMDRNDFINEAYFLEVSSPGIERELRCDEHFNNAINEIISVKLYSPVNKKKAIEGKLLENNSDDLLIEDNNESVKIDKKNISKANIVFSF